MNTAAARSTTASCSSSVASARRNIDRHGRPRAATMFGGNSSSSSCTRVDIVGALKGSGQQRPGRGHRSSRLAVAADVSRGGLVVDRLEFTPVNSGTVVLKEVNLRIPPHGVEPHRGPIGFRQVHPPAPHHRTQRAHRGCHHVHGPARVRSHERRRASGAGGAGLSVPGEALFGQGHARRADLRGGHRNPRRSPSDARWP